MNASLKRKQWLPLLVALSLACNTLLPTPTATPFAPTPISSATIAAATPTVAPTARVESPSATPQLQGLQPQDIVFHPGPELYAGDIISFEVDGSRLDAGWTVAVYHNDELLGEGELQGFGMAGTPKAALWWVWDTGGLAGEQTLTIVARPPENDTDGEPQSVTLTVTLLPAEQRPQPERNAQWARAESACCIFHYLTGTAAERDIELLQQQADAAFEVVADRLGVERRHKVIFTLLSRLLGHGGFASGEISITYIDRNAAGNNFDTVFVHEGVHILDRAIANHRPAFLAEGLAVFIAGGHYKPENLDRRAAALLAWERYIPLADLARNFYPAQHEIGYLEAGSLVKYLVDTYGWDQFRMMYATLQPAPDDATQLDNALSAHYDKSLSDIEAEWLAHLRGVAIEEGDLADLRLSVALFDTLRRYQQLHDPAAYYLSAWLPDGPEARKRAITADFIRSPKGAQHVALEAMLAAAEQALAQGTFAQVETLLRSVNVVLDAGDPAVDVLAARYLRAVTDLATEGYELQMMDLLSDEPTLTAIREWPTVEVVAYNGQ
ncbi:MAG: hypothetical protein ACT4QE_07110 [Anaerolineales bacterium]